MSVKGYLWAELVITDRERFESDYSVFVRPLLARYGAKFVIVDDHPQSMEGGRALGRTVLVEFESPEVAKAFYDDPEYQAIIPARQRWAPGHVYLTSGT